MNTDFGTWTGGLTEKHETFFPAKPDDPEMRESTSIWLFEENGAFAFPRIGIEGEAWSWDNRLYHANFNMGGGRVLHDTGRGPIPSPIGPDGRATVFGAGPLTFRCKEPFKKWGVTFDGTAVDGTLQQQIAGTFDANTRVPIAFDIELTMVTPCWVQDNSPEKVASMSEAERADAGSMGFGWRLEHLFRGEGHLTLDGKTRSFRAVGSRIKRQSVRPQAAFRGHCWQSAVFPDGRAFGYICYPDVGDGSAPYNDGYLYQNGRMYRAHARKAPWLAQIVEQGEDVSLELESELGITRIGGVSSHSTFRIRNKEMGNQGFNLQQAGVRYTWDGMTAYGMLERSATDGQMKTNRSGGAT